MSDENDFRSHTEVLNARRRAAAVTKVFPTGEVNRGSCGEVTKIKRNADDLETIDPPRIKNGEVSRS